VQDARSPQFFGNRRDDAALKVVKRFCLAAEFLTLIQPQNGIFLYKVVAVRRNRVILTACILGVG
jgi:hypothetical protein